MVKHLKICVLSNIAMINQPLLVTRPMCLNDPFSVILALFLKAAELCSVNNCFILSERVTTGSGPRPLLVFLVPCVLLRFINL